MKLTPIPDQALLLSLLRYEPNTGKLYWKPRDLASFKTPSAGLTWNKRFANKEAFTAKRPDGYFGGSINHINLLAHRIIFKMLHGYDPIQVDHDDQDRSNNRDYNLIDASAASNSKNTKLYTNNTSGSAGVSWDAARSKWIASITVNYSHKFLGRFDLLEDAVAARKAAEILHSFPPNHGATP